MKGKGKGNTFHQFVDEASPEDIKEVDRIWRKKLSEQKNKRYTIIMFSAAAAMVIIFTLLMSLLSDGTPARHFQIEQVNYMGTQYTYLQISVPHLRFLVPQQDTKQIKILRSLGIIYSEILAWIDGNVPRNSRVLFVPNEQTMVNVLGIALATYLYPPGKLTIPVSNIKYAEMTEKNLQLMSEGRKLPVEVLVGDKLQKLNEYDLIVLENSNFHSKLPPNTNATIIIIRRESAQTTIMDSIFRKHQKIEIIRGKTNAQIRELPPQIAYALIPYQPSANVDNNYVLLLPAVSPVELCEEPVTEFLEKPWLRNLVQRIKNQTLPETAILYTISSPSAREALSALSLSIPITTDITDFKKSSRNIYIVKPSDVSNVEIGTDSLLFIEINTLQEQKSLQPRLKGLHVSVVSPYNAKGCFYPPALLPSAIPPYFLLVQA